MALPLWEVLERERERLGWSKSELLRRAGALLGKANPLRSGTYDNLRWITRKPQPQIVHALADAVDLDRGVAARLAGGDRTDLGAGDLREAIANAPELDDTAKEVLLRVYDVLAGKPSHRTTR